MTQTQVETVLALVQQVMGICIQTNAKSEALASLLIDKGLVTEAELNARIQKLAESDKKLSDALGSSGGES